MSQHGYEEVLAPNHYYDRNFDIEAAKILPGEYYVTGRNMLLVTVLGSCVSACIRDPRSGIGGMNHFMLPEGGGDEHNPLSASARYGGYAMEMLINQLVKLGANRSSLEAKVFGGGAVLRGFTTVNVGQKNSDFVLEYLQNERIRVVAQDLLDLYPRKVYYWPATGRVMVRKLKSVHNNTIIEREKDYGQRLTTSSIAGDVELFS
ncbi:MAG: chemoreceptor glutamine deamidase CheD [Pseudomonadota bacterium]